MKKLKFEKREIPQKSSEHELPFIGNAAYLPYEAGEFSSIFDGAAEKMRQKILNFPDSPIETEKAYYISFKGDDSNDGLSPETAWKTVYHLDEIEENSTVLFERGGVYRALGDKITTHDMRNVIRAKDNVTYKAYGEGPKPQILGSLQNYAIPEFWKQESENIWTFKIEGGKDVGSITFNHGEAAAVRVMNMEELNKDFLYYYSREYNVCYLYFSYGNPAEYFYDIEIVDLAFANAIISCHYRSAHNITIENLCLKYGNFGIGTDGGHNKNINIRGCEIGFIGGCLMPSGIVRWGNGVELWGPVINSSIENCWVYQCYDAGITFQCNDPKWGFSDIKFDNNLLEFNQYNIEVWASKDAKLSNISIRNNICRFAGYQVYDPRVRHGSDTSHTSHICSPWTPSYTSENYVVENNIFDTSYGWLIRGDHFNEEGYITLKNNIYLQQTGLSTYMFDYDVYNIYGIVPSVYRTEKGTVYTALNQNQMDHGVKRIDPTAKMVIFEKRNDRS